MGLLSSIADYPPFCDALCPYWQFILSPEIHWVRRYRIVKFMGPMSSRMVRVRDKDATCGQKT